MTCPPHVWKLMCIFESAGAHAYPVGGCVRDMLMGLAPHDWDLAVTTMPEQTEALCRSAWYRVIPTGLAHGTVTVLVPRTGDIGEGAAWEPVECTTCRTESGYRDGRHPDRVCFTGRIEEDLSRRDFTVNAMALCLPAVPFDGTGNPGTPPDLKILDPFGGQEDLRRGVIRCVGDPDTRLGEDALRVLRAVRFAVRLGFSLDAPTCAALHFTRQGQGLVRISRERVSAEFQKILLCKQASRGIRLLSELELMPCILPGGISQACSTLASGTLDALDSLPAELPVRLAFLLAGLPQEQVELNLGDTDVGHGLRLPARTLRDIRTLITGTSLNDAYFDSTSLCARRLRHLFGRSATDVLHLWAALQNPNSRLACDRLAKLIADSETVGDCVSVAELAIRGQDLQALGIRGRQIGAVLDSLLEQVITDPACNTAAYLTEQVRQMAEKAKE